MHMRQHIRITTMNAKVVGTHFHNRTNDFFSIINFNVNDAGAPPSSKSFSDLSHKDLHEGSAIRALERLIMLHDACKAYPH